MADSSSSTTPITGTAQRCSTALAKNSSPQMPAMIGQDQLGGHRGVVRGVGDAGEQPVGPADLQPVLVEPVADAADDHRQTDQDRQMRLRPPGSRRGDRR